MHAINHDDDEKNYVVCVMTNYV